MNTFEREKKNIWKMYDFMLATECLLSLRYLFKQNMYLYSYLFILWYRMVLPVLAPSLEYSWSLNGGQIHFYHVCYTLFTEFSRIFQEILPIHFFCQLYQSTSISWLYKLQNGQESWSIDILLFIMYGPRT